MPLRCLTGEQSIYSFRLGRSDWDALAEANREEHHLRMACCNSAVTLKRSRYGTQFFAHAHQGECSSAPESAEHLRAKEIIARVVAEYGWEVSVEYRHPKGNWIADILAERDGRRIVFEVQLSPQTPIETERRDERYRVDGVECVWLLKAPSQFSPANAIHAPLFYLAMKDSRGLVGPLARPLEEFVASVLNGSTVFAGCGVRLHAARYRSNQLKLDSERKVKAALAAAGEATGWHCEIDIHYEAWEKAPNRYTVQQRNGVWPIGVMLKRDGNRVAVHLDDSWLRPEVRDHYRKTGTHLVTIVFNRKTASVSANAGEGTHHLSDVSALDTFIRESLTRPFTSCDAGKA